MEIILILFLLTILFLFLYLIFKILKWLLKEQIRIKWALSLIVILVVFNLVNILFFTKIEFIPSKAIPNLYIIKNPIKNKDSLHSLIKKMVLEKVNSQAVNQIDKYKKVNPNDSSVTLRYTIDFYEYYKGSVFIPFGDAGTHYFIENEEDPGGFSVEVLDMYPKYHIAQFNLKFCKNDTIHYYGTLDYYKEWEIVKTDTLINLCKKNKK
jgi:hypothetical protein